MPAKPLVTFDVFSALVDSRSGAARVLGAWAEQRGWPADGEEVYDRWDGLNKRSHRDVTTWRSYAQLAAGALEATYTQLGLHGDVRTDCAALLDSMAHWPLWPDVDDGLAELAGQFRFGVLSNIDDDLLARTRVSQLPLDPAAIVTSERVLAYKPARRIYSEAARLLGPYVHVASSARDVKGALEAGIDVVRLSRPGHALDPDGPVPQHQATSTTRLAALITPLHPRRHRHEAGSGVFI